jgi:two-component system, cell cycle sensor histidine kinase and response regulator CckA
MPTVTQDDRAKSRAPNGIRQSLSMAWLAAGLGVGISLVLFLVVGRIERLRDEADFHAVVTAYLGGLQECRNGAEDLLRTLRAVFYQNPNLPRSLFTNVVSDLSLRMQGVQAIAWAPRVTIAQRAGFEQAARDEGFAGFQITEGDITHQPDEGPTRAPDRPEYFPLRFIEPLAGNEPAVGYDLASVPEVAQLLARTHQVGGAEISAPLPLPYQKGVKPGVLAVIPVYGPDFAPVTQPDRLRQAQGYVVEVVIIDELMKVLEARIPDLQLDVLWMDVTDPEAQKLMGARVRGAGRQGPWPANLAQFRDRPHYGQQVSIGGRKLLFDFRRSDNWNRGLDYLVPAAVLCIGLLLTGIAVQFLRSSSAKARQIEEVVRARTAELGEANAKLHAEVRERVEAQTQMARDRNLLYTLVNRLPDAIYVTDRAGKYVLANDAHTRLLQQPDPARFVGRPVRLVGPPPLAETLAAGSDEVLRAGNTVLSRECVVPRPGTEPLSLQVSKLPLRDTHGEIDGLLVITRDVTDLKRTETEKREFARRLQETQKLESLGILAGGIAHDFNNLLTIILGNATLARTEFPASSTARECLNRIEATALRAADLCRQMLAYSGKSQFLVRRVDVSHLVEAMTELLQLSISKKARLDLRLAPGLPTVLADATQLQQILMNLVINASDAIGNRDGVIRIHSGLTRVDQAYLRQVMPPPDIGEGEYVFLEVSDDGCGMDPETVGKVFDPFFSTKFTGRGLGLAAVLGIVRGHRGAITVQSEVGKGSTFRLLLPRVEGRADQETPPRPTPDAWKGNGTLLLADDEEAVRLTTAGLLNQAGFTVDLVDSGRAAVEKFQTAPNRYRAVLLDLTMPNGDGEEAFREIRRIQPGARILMMSGFGSQEVADRFAGTTLSGFIQKPFLGPDLVAALRHVLDGSAEASRPS